MLALGEALSGVEIWPVPAGVVAGLALLWLAGAAASRSRAPWLIGPALALPGALVLASANDGLESAWVQVLIVLGCVLIGATTADFDRRTAPYGLGTLLLFVTLVGIDLTVPDTELMRAVVGAALPLVLLAWPYAAASLGAGGAYAAVGLLLWIAPIEGIGRPGSIVGAAGAFALLVGEPLGRVLGRAVSGRWRRRRFPIPYPRSTVVAAQILLVLYATRVAGLVSNAFAAVVVLIPASVAAVAFGALLVVPEAPRRRIKA